MDGLVGLEGHGGAVEVSCGKLHFCHVEGRCFSFGQDISIEIQKSCDVSPLARFHILLVHTRIAVIAFCLRLGQDGCFRPYFHVPDGRHVSVLLGIGYADADILSLHSLLLLVNHG